MEDLKEIQPHSKKKSVLIGIRNFPDEVQSAGHYGSPALFEQFEPSNRWFAS
jgi:hypothetical protein